MKHLQLSANVVNRNQKKINVTVPDKEEQLLLVKSGTLTVSLHDSLYSIEKGSIALVLPGDVYTLENKEGVSVEYYLMKYSSKTPVDLARGKSFGGSFVKDWKTIEFKTHERGGRRDFFERPTPMCKRFEMHVTTLNAGLKSHDPHTHRAEEIILIMEGKTEMQIEDKFYKATVGDVIFVASGSLHGIRNEGTTPCTYFAFQFE